MKQQSGRFGKNKSMTDTPGRPVAGSATLEPSGQAYSRAFECFTKNDPRDVEGLLAYALYKNAIREKKANGQDVPPATRTPVPSEVQTYRSQAQLLLRDFGLAAIQDAERDWQEYRSKAEILAVKTSIESLSIRIPESAKSVIDSLGNQIKASTNFRSAVIANLVAWLASLGITALVILTSSNSIEKLWTQSGNSAPSAQMKQSD